MKLFNEFFNGLVVIIEFGLFSGQVKERARNCCPISWTFKGFLSFSKLTDLLSSPPDLYSMSFVEYFPKCKAAVIDADYSN
jgi:hypothetical protein